jgi:hypothetical protein
MPNYWISLFSRKGTVKLLTVDQVIPPADGEARTKFKPRQQPR